MRPTGTMEKLARLEVSGSFSHGMMADRLAITERYLWDAKSGKKTPREPVQRHIDAECNLVHLPKSADLPPQILWLRRALCFSHGEALRTLEEEIAAALRSGLEPRSALHLMRGNAQLRLAAQKTEAGLLTYAAEPLHESRQSFSRSEELAPNAFWAAVGENNRLGAEFLIEKYLKQGGRTPDLSYLLKMHGQYRALTDVLQWPLVWRDCLDFSTLLEDAALVEGDFDGLLAATRHKPRRAVDTLLRALDGFEFLEAQTFYKAWKRNERGGK